MMLAKVFPPPEKKDEALRVVLDYVITQESFPDLPAHTSLKPHPLRFSASMAGMRVTISSQTRLVLVALNCLTSTKCQSYKA